MSKTVTARMKYETETKNKVRFKEDEDSHTGMKYCYLNKTHYRELGSPVVVEVTITAKDTP